jgi:ribosomal protein S8
VAEPITLHDNSETKKEEMERELRKCFTAKDITIIETDDGVLTLRPSEIIAILLQEEKEEKKNLAESKTIEKPEKPVSPPMREIKELKEKPEEIKITDDNIDGEKK